MAELPTTNVYVVRTGSGELEVFVSLDDARAFAQRKQGATVVERSLRRTLSEASLVYERRLHIAQGRVCDDTSNEEFMFAVGEGSGIPWADVESFEASDDKWTVVGLGIDRPRVDELIADEVIRLTTSAG